MKRFTALIATAACSLPLLAIAQTSPKSAVTPPKVEAPDQPRSDLEKKQSEQTGNAPKYGDPGSSSSSQTTNTDKASRTSRAKQSSKTSKTDADSSSTPTPTNTVSPTKTN